MSHIKSNEFSKSYEPFYEWLKSNSKNMISSLFTAIIAVLVCARFSVSNEIAGIIAIFAFLIINLTIRFVQFLWRSRKIGVTLLAFRNWNEKENPGCKKFKVNRTLADAAKNGWTIEVIARTAICWLAGPENEFDKYKEIRFRNSSSPNSYKETKYWEHFLKLQNRIVSAVNPRAKPGNGHKGAKIRFYLQHPDVKMSWMSKENQRKNIDHYIEALERYKDTYTRTDSNPNDNFTLYTTDAIVDSSMTRISSKDKVRRLIVSLGVRFLSRRPVGEVEKPFIVFETKSGDIEDFKDRFDDIVNNARKIEFSQIEDEIKIAQNIRSKI